MKVPLHNLSLQYLPLKEEIDQMFVDQAMTGNHLGLTEVTKFEQKFAQFTEAEDCVGVSSGTDALRMALRAFEVSEGDEVIVLTGKDKGKKGKIIKMVPKQMKAVVSEINKVKKNQKPDNNQPGGIIDKEMPIHISNLLYYDAEQKKGVKIGFKLDNNKKIRINKSSGKEIK